MMLNKLRTFPVADQILDKVEVTPTEVHQLGCKRLMIWFHFPTLCFCLGTERLQNYYKN